jgi:hypothetical protein
VAVGFLDWQCPTCNRLERDLVGFTTSKPPLCSHPLGQHDPVTGVLLEDAEPGYTPDPVPTPMEIRWMSSASVFAWEPGKRPKYWNEAGEDKEFANLHEIRKYEKECERRSADGAGQISIARDFSQNSHNMLDPVLPDPSKRARPFTHDGRKLLIRRLNGIPGE